jgi:hypothetical protein
MFANAMKYVGGAVVLLLALVVLGGGEARAQYYWGSKPLAMGGAFTAVADDINAIQWNPAGLSKMLKRKQFGVEFNYERHEYLLGDYKFLHEDLFKNQNTDNFGNDYFYNSEPEVNLKQKMSEDWYHIALADGSTNQVVAVGLAFTGMNFPTATFKEGQSYSTDVCLAFSVADIFAMGVTPRYIDFNSEGAGRFDIDAGVLFNAVNIISIGVAGRHLTGSDDPMRIRRDLAFGVAGHVLEYATISAEATKGFDVVNTKGSFNFSFGAEGVIAKMFALRAGYNWDQVYSARQYSVGAAFVDKRGSLGYTFQGDVDQVRDFTHSIELAVFFP